jgi:hypothetical protein
MLFHIEEATILFLVEIERALLTFLFQLSLAFCELCNRESLEIFLLLRFKVKICLCSFVAFAVTAITCEV